MRSGLILAGGFSKRMGRAKALIVLGTKPFVRWVADALLSTCDEVTVVLRKDEGELPYRRVLPASVQIKHDRFEEQSPLIGIVSGLEGTKSEYSAVFSCDLPFINTEVVRNIFEKTEGNDAAIPIWDDGRIEPLHAVYKTSSALYSARQCLEAGDDLSNHAMIRRLKSVNFVPTKELKLHDPNLLSFTNVNTLDDLKKAEITLRQIQSRKKQSENRT